MWSFAFLINYYSNNIKIFVIKLQDLEVGNDISLQAVGFNFSSMRTIHSILN